MKVKIFFQTPPTIE